MSERPVYVLAIGHDLGDDDAERIQRAVVDALRDRCSQEFSYTPIGSGITTNVRCHLGTSHDGAHQSDGYGGASVVWPCEVADAVDQDRR